MATKTLSIEEQMGEAECVQFSLYKGEVILNYNDSDHKYFIDIPEGRVHVPNVTTILKVIDKSNVLIPWAIKECVEYIREKLLLDTIADEAQVFTVKPKKEWEDLLKNAKSAHRAKKERAGDIGHIAHNWLEAYGRRRISGMSHDRATTGWTQTISDEKAQNCVRAALDWIVEHHVEPVEVERKIYSRDYNYAGTLDWKGFVDGKLSILDFKSSKYLYDEYRLQVASYQSAVEEEDGCQIEQRILLRLGKEDGEFEVATFDDRSEYEADRLAFLSALDLQQRLEQFQAEYKAKQAAKKVAKKKAA